MRACMAGKREYELEALVDYGFRRRNGLPGYQSIIGSGKNATILHYVDGRDELVAGQVLLVDAGCELDGFTGDVTRSYPIPAPSCKPAFSRPQRLLYDLVLDTQLAAIAMVKPFVTIEETEDICEYAKHFRASTKQYCEPAIHSGDLIQINQCKIRLLDRYFEWKAAVPKSHRNRIGEHSHICIFHIFETAYNSLRIAELSISGPPIYLPPPPPPKPLPGFAGFYIGEAVEEENINKPDE
jgi:methionine aminopeptidase